MFLLYCYAILLFGENYLILKRSVNISGWSKKRINLGYRIVLALFLSGFIVDQFSRQEYYKVFSEDYLNDMEVLSKKIEELKDVDAYKGALLMKMSGLLDGVGLKLRTFKRGRELLETAIDKNPQNAEWRFLRYAVQEYAPSIVHYDNNMEEDRAIIINNFSSFDVDIQIIIRNFARESESFNPVDLPK